MIDSGAAFERLQRLIEASQRKIRGEINGNDIRYNSIREKNRSRSIKNESDKIR